MMVEYRAKRQKTKNNLTKNLPINDIWYAVTIVPITSEVNRTFS